eukprot:Rhum_TRINITY_DN11825_c0_g1::Rhum_TRINITY_DN11825_c0_g1_i1::g.47346::m.47346
MAYAFLLTLAWQAALVLCQSDSDGAGEASHCEEQPCAHNVDCCGGYYCPGWAGRKRQCLLKSKGRWHHWAVLGTAAATFLCVLAVACCVHRGVCVRGGQPSDYALSTYALVPAQEQALSRSTEERGDAEPVPAPAARRGEDVEVELASLPDVGGSLTEELVGAATAVPEHMLCPISLQVMADPVLCVSQKHSFDRAFLARALQERPECPMGREPMTREDMVSNIALREEIHDFVSAHRPAGVIVAE